MSSPNPKMHLGPPQLVAQHQKDAEATQLRADIEAFQAAGGVIQVLGNTPTRPMLTKGVARGAARKKPGPKTAAEREAANDNADTDDE